MKPILIILSLCSLAVLAVADLPVSLKAHADKFEADRAALTASAEKHLKPARDRYLLALTSAEKAATAAGKQQDAVAIAAEMRDVGAGTPAEEFPPDLPRALVPQRRDYMTAMATAAKTVPTKLRELADKYLQAIAAFEKSGLKPTDAAIINAVSAEKQRVMDLVEAAGGSQKHQNVVANSDFSQGEPGTMPAKWRPRPAVSPLPSPLSPPR